MKLYHNGPILPMSPHPDLQALLEKDGRIAALGTYEELRACGAQEVDLRGRALLPAFLDPHSHITALASTIGLCQLSAAASFDGIAAALVDFAAGKPGSQWLLGFNYDHNTLSEHAHPTRQVLDRDFPDTPVLITHASGHMGVMNSAALGAVGITADTPDPEGGRIGREADGRTPSGYLEETAFRSASAKVPMDRAADASTGLQAAQQVYLSNGITLVQDGLTGLGAYQMLSTAARRGGLSVDVVGYADMKKAPQLQHEPCWGRFVDRLKLGGWKIFLDGSPQGRTAWMLEPYLGGDGTYTGYPTYTDQEVLCFVKTALAQGVQLLAHCNGDAAAAQYIRCCRMAQEELNRPIRDIRPVMIHAQLLRPQQLREMKALGILPSFFPAHLWYWGDVHVENFGSERAGDISPMDEAVRLGLPFTMHQDTPVIAPDIMESVWCAVNRVTRSGAVLGPERKISVYEALKAVTVNAAYQYFMEGQRGSLDVGKVADFVILDRDPMRVRAEELREVRVVETVKNGERLFQR